MTLEEIRELIRYVTESGVAELEVQRGDQRVRIRRVAGRVRQDVILPAEPQHNPVATAPGIPAAAHPNRPAAAPKPPAAFRTPEEELAEAISDPANVVVKSPIVGTFYEAPAPGAPPFVLPGDTVRPGQVLCIIESMKLMNEIEAEVAGTILTKLVNNAQPVEYGEALFVLKPFDTQ